MASTARLVAEAIPAPAFGEATVLLLVAVVVAFWLIKKLIKIAVVVVVLGVLGFAVLSGVRTVERPPDVQPWTSSTPSPRALTRALERTGVLKPPDACAHHIVAGAAWQAAPARQVLFAQRIDINDAVNGVFIECSYHRRLHTNTYYLEVNRRILASPAGQVRAVLRRIAAQLLSHTFPI